MKAETYLIDSNSEIFLYGVNSVSVELMQELKNKKMKVVAFVDQKARDIPTIDEVPVVSIKEVDHYWRELSQVIIIICLNDGGKHQGIANMFYEKQIRKILFLPLGERMYSNEFEHRMRFAYIENVIHRHFDIDIPFCAKIYTSKHKVINDFYKAHISIWCDISELYVGENLIGRAGYTINWTGISGDNKASEVPFYKDLFDYLSGKSNSEEDLFTYLIYQGRVEEQSQKALINNRYNLYQYYLEQYMYNFSFFLDSPIECDYNIESKKLTVRDGYHRLYFLMSKGLNSVPIIIKKGDFAILEKGEHN